MTTPETSTDSAAEIAAPATPRHPLAWDRRTLLLALAVFAAAFAVFSRTLAFDFVEWDDDRNILMNPHYRPVTAAGTTWFWNHAYNDQYMPVTWSAWAGCAAAGAFPELRPRLGGEPAPFSPFPFHLLAMMAHALNAVLVFALLRRLLGRAGEVPAALGAVLFAVHPLQAESAAWINGGNITLAYLFGIGSLLLYLRWAQEGNKGSAVAATALYILGLLAKPTIVAIPLAAIVLEVLALRRPVRQWAPLIAAWLAIAVGSVLLQWSYSVTSQSLNIPVTLRPFVAGDALAFYLGKLVFPRDLTPGYSRTPAAIAAQWWGYATWLIPAGIAVAVWRSRNRMLQTAAGISLAALLPVLGLVPFYYQQQSTVADRYAYFAMVGVGLAFAVLFLRLRDKAPLLARVTVPALALLGLTAASEAEHWRNNFTLYPHAIAINPQSATMQYNFAKVSQTAGQIEDAEKHYREAIRLRRAYPDAYTNLGTLLVQTGHAEEGLAQYQEALRWDPDQPQANYHLGSYWAEHGDTSRALSYWQAALKRWPNSPSTHYNMAVALHARKQDEEAKQHLQAALAAMPSMEPARQLLAQIDAPGKSTQEAGAAPNR